MVARSLRSALRELALLNTTSCAARRAERARIDAALGSVTLMAELDEAGRLAPAAAGAGIARALASLVAIVLDAQAAGEWGRVKACRQATCGWLFYDGSRNRSSSWCSMSICGNRAKTAAYRRRRGGSGDGHRYVAWLAWRRVRRRHSGALVAALGLAVGAAVIACLLMGVTVATDRSTANAIERIPADARATRASWFGVPAGGDESLATLDGHVRAAMPGDPFRLVLVRESTVAGRFVGLAAVNGLAEHVILRSGRLPRRCTATLCEVLRLRGAGRIPNAPGLRLVEVGTATLRSRQLFGDFLEPTDNATADAEVAPAVRAAARYHRPAPAPLVVAEGVDALASSPALAGTYRSYAWVWPLADGKPHLWEIDELVAQVERGRAALTSRSSSFSVGGPVQELRAAERTSTVAGRRLLLVGGEAAALLLAFAVLAARGMRRDLEASRRRLTWNGAGRGQLTLLTVVESAAVASPASPWAGSWGRPPGASSPR